MNLIRQPVEVKASIHIFEKDGAAGEAVGYELRRIYTDKGFKYALSNRVKKNDAHEDGPYTQMDITIHLADPTVRSVQLAMDRVRNACIKIGRQEKITMVFPADVGGAIADTVESPPLEDVGVVEFGQAGEENSLREDSLEDTSISIQPHRRTIN